MARNGLNALFVRLTRRPALLAAVLCVCGTVALPFRQGSATKEVGATIQTYWPRPQFTLKTYSNLVEVGVVDRNDRGRAIGGLRKDDFEVEDAGRKREISAFSVETFVPSATQPPAAAKAAGAPPETATTQLRYVALVFDDFSMPFAQLAYVKAAARRFVKEGLDKGDRVGLFTTSGRQIVPFTADIARLAAAVDRYTSHPRVPDGGSCPKLTPYDAYVIANKIDPEALAIKVAELAACSPTSRKGGGGGGGGAAGSFGSALTRQERQIMAQADVMWAQIRDTSGRALDTMGRLVDYMGQLPGKRMVVLASSGFLVRTLETEQEKVISQALRAEVVINALDAKGLYTEEPPEMSRGVSPASLWRMTLLGTREKDLGNDIMATLVMSTGGLFFDNNNDLDLGFREVGMLPEVSYLLGFSLQEVPDGKYHTLKVRLKSTNQYLIQARPGYWAVPNHLQGTAIQERRVDREVMGSGTLTEIPALVGSMPSKTDSGEPAVDVVLHLDVRGFHFVEKDGVRTQRVVFIGALFDDGGNFVAGKEAEIRFALKQPTYERLAESGLDMSLTLPAPPGTYRLRAVAQDTVDGKVVSSTLPVEIR